MNQKQRRRSLAIGSLAVVSALALTGCFSNGGAGTGAAGGESARIRVAMALEPVAGLSVFSDDASTVSRWGAIESLVQLDETGAAQPRLATEWKQIDDLTWEFALREGVTFQDGTKLDAKAVVNSLQKALAAKPLPRSVAGLQMTFDTPDDVTVRITTGTPEPILPQRLSSPQLAILSAAAYTADGTASPVGTATGPFKVTNVGGKSTFTLDRYDGYWGEKAKAPGIDVTIVTDGTARAAALRTGTADVAVALPISQLPQIDPELVQEFPSPRTTTLYMNTAKGVFADPAMRAAARAAIDPSVLANDVYEGRADAAQGLFGPALPWAKDLRGNVASSVAPGDPQGKQITLATYSDRPELPEDATRIQQELEKAGFVVKQDVRTNANFIKDALSGAFDLVIGSRSTQLDTGDPVSFLASDFTCKSTGLNFAQLCNPEVDAAVANASAQKAGPDRQKAIMGVEAMLLQQNVIVPLVNERLAQGQATGVSGVVRDPFERRLITNETTAAR
ncbi:ABC transporter substrate-binding protein [Sinomonas mesophila]|uniref:ABC transporter substrate-binding protein n=1 Tax=Sinomonas mesophila TaxID=1531955 RepID=UPI0009854256|nr:ABC transporter substrate-binding protein [Sinomonas mesophila]